MKAEREVTMKRELFTPTVGKTYRNQGGGTYICTRVSVWDGLPTMRNTASGWTLTAHGIGIYEDGTIDWDYSTGGYFADEEEKA